MIHLYVDEDAMDKNLIQALRARGVDVLTAWEANMIERTDEEHLHYATAQNRVLYTFNVRDFYRLHIAFLSQGRSHGGIILARQQAYSVRKQMSYLLKLIASKSAEEMKSQVEFLSAWD